MSGTMLIDQAHRAIGVPSSPLITSGLNGVISCLFADSGSGLLSTDLVNLTPASVMAVSQANNALVITAGTTASAEFLARSVKSFRGASISRHRLTSSVRIANANFSMMLADKIGDNLACTINSATQITVTVPYNPNLVFSSLNVGQSMMVGGIFGAAGVPGRYAIASVTTNSDKSQNIVFTVAGWPATGSCTVDLFGWNYVRTFYTGATGAVLQIESQRKGWNNVDASVTTLTSNSPGHIIQKQLYGRAAYWADTLASSNAAASFTGRGSRFTEVPDDDTELYVYVWAYNGTTSPASSVVWTLGGVTVEDITNNKVQIGGIDQLGDTAPLPVKVAAGTNSIGTVILGTGSATIGNVGILASTNTGDGNQLSRILTGDTNAVVVKGSVTRIASLTVHNDSATKFYVKIYNKATAPVLGTDTPIIRIPVPANSSFAFDCGAAGIRISSGFGIAVTRGLADSDTTAVAANDGVVNAVYS